MNEVHVTVNDVVLRDGLQDEPVLVSVPDRLAIARALVAAGVRHIEAASFVDPARVPQMAGAEELVANLPHRGSVRYSVLALNARGVRRAVAAGAERVNLVVSASPAHSRANAGRDVDGAVENLASVVAGHPRVRFSAGIATAFVDPSGAEVAPSAVLAVAKRFASTGIGYIGLADTLGTARPAQVLRSLDVLRNALPDLAFGLHLHNAHGQALATVDAAIGAGITRFDSAAGGYGGCPFAPGGGPNIATEDLIGHLHAAAVDTGIDEALLAEAVIVVKRSLAGATPLNTRPTHGMS